MLKMLISLCPASLTYMVSRAGASGVKRFQELGIAIKKGVMSLGA